MESSQDNKVVQLCTKGMELEAQGQQAEAAKLFKEAWDIAATDFEKSIAAHYVARYQQSIADKLTWDETALKHALNVPDDTKGMLPSLYLNIGKCYEDISDLRKAETNYQAAFSLVHFLTDDGYGSMIKRGIVNGLARIK